MISEEDNVKVKKSEGRICEKADLPDQKADQKKLTRKGSIWVKEVISVKNSDVLPKTQV